MSRLFRSFYARLSTIFLLLILALGGGAIAIAFTSAGHLFDEVEQLLNRAYAGSIAEELAPLVAQGFKEEGIRSAIHYMMVLNPMVEIYLLDGSGRILAYFAHPSERLVRETVDLAPIKTLVENRGGRFLRGEDPRSASGLKPFSAARLRMGDERGYVYVILRGQSYDRSLQTLRDSYYLRAGLMTFLLALLATLLLGFSLFFLLTRRLRTLSQAVKAFQRGELDRRVSMPGNDELGALGRSFNDLAADIEAGVARLRLAERQRRDLVANISHDLRSPLASIRGYLETILLKDGQLEPERRREFLRTVLKSVSGFQNLVEELFELAKLETGQVLPKHEPFQIAELVQDVVLKFKPQADASSVTLAADLPEELPPVLADIGMIERVLTNLIDNALRFTPSGRSVRVAVSRQDGGIRIAVADDGLGIAPEDLPHIFERFFRAGPDRDRSAGGAGLGLAIARQIVQLHGGRLEVESRLNEGTRFQFVLSCAPGAGRA
jgi:signal transduction histidine kinase